MSEEIVISVNRESSDLFIEFSKHNEDTITFIDQKSFIGLNEIVEFVVSITPHTLAALSAYLVAKMQFMGKNIKVKKGDIEIELANMDISPESVLELLKKLEE